MTNREAPRLEFPVLQALPRVAEFHAHPVTTVVCLAALGVTVGLVCGPRRVWAVLRCPLRGAAANGPTELDGLENPIAVMVVNETDVMLFINFRAKIQMRPT